MSNDDDETPMSVQRVRSILRKNPFEGFNLICSEFEAGERRRNQQIYNSIGLLAEYVVLVELSEEEQKKLYADSFWDDKPYTNKPDEIALTCTMRMLQVKAAGQYGYQTAWDYAQCIESMLDHNVKPTDIADMMRRLGGIKGVLRHFRVPRPAATLDSDDGTSSPAREPGLGDGDEDNEVDEEEDLLPPIEPGPGHSDQRPTAKRVEVDPPRKSGDAEDEERLPQLRRPSIFKQERDMAVEAGQFFGRFFRMPIGSEVPALIVREPDEEGIARYRFSQVGPARPA